MRCLRSRSASLYCWRGRGVGVLPVMLSTARVAVLATMKNAQTPMAKAWSGWNRKINVNTTNHAIA